MTMITKTAHTIQYLSPWQQVP